MRRTMRGVTAAAVAAAILAGGAMAAGTPAAEAPAERQVAVQLNGEWLTFSDAVPQVRDQRTFLPFRAVFEALGADVSWSAEAPDRVSASRGGRTVTMTLGSTQAVVTQAGVESALTMDVAPFAENGRTYVPVRFAAQAFDCAVGWDQGAYAALLVDVDALAEKAVAGKSFTRLGQYKDRVGQRRAGTWTAEADLAGSLTMLGLELPVSGTLTSVTAGDGMEATVQGKVDTTTLLVLSAFGGGLDAETTGLLTALKDQGLTLSLRGEGEKRYLSLAGVVLGGSSWTPGSWYELPPADGWELDRVLGRTEGTAEEYAKAIVKFFLGTMTPMAADSEGYATSYADFPNWAESVAASLSDEGVYQDGEDLVCGVDGGQNKLELRLTLRDGAVVGHGSTVTRDADSVTTAVDDGGGLTGNIRFQTEGLGLELTLSGRHAPGGEAPQTRPPEGAAVSPLPPEGRGLLGK